MNAEAMAIVALILALPGGMWAARVAWWAVRR